MNIRSLLLMAVCSGLSFPVLAQEDDTSSSVWSWYGDLKRNRSRFRFGARRMFDNLEFGIALEAALGSDDNRDNRRNNDNERSDAVNLDEFYLRWNAGDNTSLLFGRTALPLSLTPMLWDADLRPIIATVGGNPLALLLVVGLTHVHSLTVVLRHLREARGLPAENLYTYIYRQAWDALDERHRQVLLAMPLTALRGETLEFVAAICDLPLAVTADVLHRLYMLNLVTAGGDLHRRRYAIHSLTRTFLQEQVARWL